MLKSAVLDIMTKSIIASEAAWRPPSASNPEVTVFLVIVSAVARLWRSDKIATGFQTR